MFPSGGGSGSCTSGQQLMNFWSECGTFLKESRRHFRATGALLPSSRFLARTLAAPLSAARPPCRILEVGPGTGAVTRAIARRMIPGDQLDAVELNPRFVERLRLILLHDPVLIARRPQIRVIQGPVQELEGEAVYDHIISGLPLNNFPVTLVRDIFKAYSRLLKPGGVLTYFEYVLIRQLKTPFVGRRERRRLYRVGRVVSEYIRAYQVRRKQVLMNVPPAIVRHLHLKPTGHIQVREVKAPKALKARPAIC
jgi:phosphatidylethanolamine/phosphatidyl-N-methylethanolamine N-methyltransferase